jgi:hypothetical protein
MAGWPGTADAMARTAQRRRRRVWSGRAAKSFIFVAGGGGDYGCCAVAAHAAGRYSPVGIELSSWYDGA